MKKRHNFKALVTLVTLFALVLSMGGEMMIPPVVSELAIVAAGSSSEEPGYGSEDDDPRRPQFYLRSGPRTISGNVIQAGEVLPAGFFPGGSGNDIEVELRLRGSLHENPGDWVIYYTMSAARANQDNAVTPLGPAFSGAVEPRDATTRSGVNFGSGQDLHDRLGRHDGGVSPILIDPVRGTPILNAQGHRQINRGRQGGDGARRFDGRIRIHRDVCAASISAVAHNTVTGETSDVITRSWIRERGTGRTGSDILEPAFHENMLIFHLTTDAHGIYDFNDGIFTPGVDRQQWVTAYQALNPGHSIGQILGYMDSHHTMGYYPPTLTANFTRRGREAAERAVHVEAFTPDGERIINQRAGMRIKGGWSRGTFALDQKTFELYARGSMGDRSNFLFPLFGQQNSNDGNLMHRYSRFRLRNGGSDREATYMKDELAHDLAAMAGYPGVQNHRPGVVYINGAYYGLVWLKTPRTEEHWRRTFGGFEDRFEHIGQNEMGRDPCGRRSCGRAHPTRTQNSYNPRTDRMPAACTDENPCGRPDCRGYWSGWNSGCGCPTHGQDVAQCTPSCPAPICRGVGTPSAATPTPGSWDEVVRLATGSSGPVGSTQVRAANTGGATGGLTNEANWARFNELVCVDNLIHFYALQIFAANVDWPSNNIEFWRYFPEADEITAVGRGELAQELDGRWRVIAQDLEFGWGHFPNGNPIANATNPESNTIYAVLNRTGTERGVPGTSGANTTTGPEWDNPGRGRFHFNATESGSFMIPALMRRPDMRAALANALNDLIDTSHSPQVMQAVYGHLTWNIRAEHERMLGIPTREWEPVGESALGRRRTWSDTIRISELPRNGTRTGSTGDDGGMPHGPTHRSVFTGFANEGQPRTSGSHEYTQHFIANRSTNVRQHVTSTLTPGGTQGAVTVNITSNPGQWNQGGEVVLNNMPLGRPVMMGMSSAWAERANAPAWATTSQPSGAWVNVDPRIRTSATANYFFNGNTVPITVQPWEGYRLVGGTVAGAAPCPRRHNTWLISAGGTFNIAFERIPMANVPHSELQEQLRITAVQAQGDGQGRTGNWIEITNHSDQTITTRGLYMTNRWNSAEDPNADPSPSHDRHFDFRWRMPAVIIRPGQTIFIKTSSSDNTIHEALKHLRRGNPGDPFDGVNFGISFGDRLRIANSQGEVFQRVEISLMTNDEFQLRHPNGDWRIVDWNGQRGQGRQQ
jgi:hypothetical protein